MREEVYSCDQCKKRVNGESELFTLQARLAHFRGELLKAHQVEICKECLSESGFRTHEEPERITPDYSDKNWFKKIMKILLRGDSQ